ncbi:MAG TPA: GtrA family protein [Blastocatellia bacterium]|nr:GtrA family protein [Blastocatellia bacterium]
MGDSADEYPDDIGNISRIEIAGQARHERLRPILQRFLRFSAVGAGGVLVQTLTLGILLRAGGMHYLMATAVAVEASVLNNFVWHRRWTWADRPRSSAALVLLRFNATNGAVSLIGNLGLMLMLVGGLKLNPHAANLITIVICSLINFALADRVVFTP